MEIALYKTGLGNTHTYYLCVIYRVATSSGQKSGKFDWKKRKTAETKTEKAEKKRKAAFCGLFVFLRV
jgi:hypothetical protein